MKKGIGVREIIGSLLEGDLTWDNSLDDYRARSASNSAHGHPNYRRINELVFTQP